MDHQKPEYHQVELFGGAITADLPSSYFDTSNIREVPDHQEVYLEKDGYSSLTIEILERVNTGNGSDEAALEYHLDDIVDATDDRQIKSGRGVVLPKLSEPAFEILALITPKDRPESGDDAKLVVDVTAIAMVMVRLVKQETDLLLTVNRPFHRGKYDPAKIDLANGQTDEIWAAPKTVLDKLVQTLEIKDWNLFGQ